MNKEDKFIVTDATDIICIGGFGNYLGNIGLLKYNEQEIANMMIENNTKVDDIRLANSLLNTIKKQKERIDKRMEYMNKNLILVSILDGVKTFGLNSYTFDYKELLEILAGEDKEVSE